MERWSQNRYPPIRYSPVTLFDQADQATDFILSKINRIVPPRDSAPVSETRYQIPKEVIQEAVVNAVAHRDYTSAASVQVSVFSDRIEVRNPGSLPPDLTFEDLKIKHYSRPRNHRIALPLYLTHYIEKIGYGTIQMTTGCRDAGLPVDRAVTDVSEDGIIVIDSRGEQTYRNKQAARLLKASQHLLEADEKDVKIESFLDFVKSPSQFRQDVLSLTDGTTECLRYEVELVDATVLDVYSSPVFGRDGTYYGRIWMFRDVTERKAAEEAVRRSEATLRSVFSASPVGMALARVGRVAGWANGALCAMTGFSAEEIDGQSPRMLYETEEEFLRVGQALYAAMSTGAAHMTDAQWQCKDGTIIDVSLGAVCVDPENPASDVVITAVDITERKQVEETLRDSENKFRDLAEKSILGISLVQDGFYRFVNSRFAELHGRTVDEMTDSPRTVENVYREDRERVAERMQEGPAEDTLPMEMRIVDDKGDLRTVLAYSSVSTYRRRPATIVTLLDITQQRRAEQAVRENEVRLEYATELAKIVYWERDEEAGEFVFNDAFYALYGTTAEREGGYRMDLDKYFERFVHPDDRGEVRRLSAANRARADTQEVSMSHRIVRPDGSNIFILSRMKLVRDADGRIIKTIGANQDITEQKQVEDALVWKTAFLEAQANSSLDGILVVDERGRTILRNQRLIDMWKLPRHIIEGADEKEEFAHVLSMTRHPEAFKEKMVFLYRHPSETSRDEIDLKDGTVLDTYSCPVLGENGAYYGRIWTYRDVTELRHYWNMLESLSNTDGLTDLPNRRRFDEFLNREWRRAVRDKSNLSLIMMDIDFFKEFNDNYGHLAGDDCLCRVARLLNEVIQRPGDLAARYGGEEFACILPDTDSEGALNLAGKIRNGIKAANIPHFFSSIADHITLSFGVATLIPEAGEMPSELVRLADDLLYSAKKGGRDQVRRQSGRPESVRHARRLA